MKEKQKNVTLVKPK